MNRFLTLFLLVNLVFLSRCDDDDEGLEEVCALLGDNGAGLGMIVDCIGEFLPENGMAVVERCVAEETNEVGSGSTIGYLMSKICAAGGDTDNDKQLVAIEKCVDDSGIDMELSDQGMEAAEQRAEACMETKLNAIISALEGSSEEK